MRSTAASADKILYGDVEFPRSFRDELWFKGESIKRKQAPGYIRGKQTSISMCLRQATYRLDDGRFVSVNRDGCRLSVSMV